MMKKIFILICSFILITLSTTELKSQSSSCTCTYPYTSASTTYSIDSSCVITINYCLDCAPTGHPVMKLCNIIVPTDICDTLVIDANFWDAVKEEMLISAVNICGGIGPCPTRVAIDIYQASCWQLVNDWENEMVHIVPCDEEPGECMQEFEVCFNGGNLEITPGIPEVIEEGECGYESIIIAPYPYSLFEGCFNSCY